MSNYKNTLSRLPTYREQVMENLHEFSNHDFYLIAKALKIADKLLHEPSFEMVLCGCYEKREKERRGAFTSPEILGMAFKAMRGQLLREVDDV